MIHSLFGLNSLNQNFNYNPSQWNATTGTYAGASDNTQTSMTGLGDIGQYSLTQAQNLMDPNSQYNQQQRQMTMQGLSDQGQGLVMGQNRALAARGMGGGGLSGILGASSQNRVGEQAIRAMMGLQQQQIGQGSNLLGISSGAYGQMGQLSGAESGRGLQMNLANLSAQNAAGQYNAQAADAARQYQMTSEYNQSAGNRASRGQFFGNVMGLAGSMFAPGLAGLVGGASSAMGGAGGGMGYTPPPPPSGMGGYGGFQLNPYSDIRVKDNIEYLHTSPEGHNVYAFNYKNDNIKYSGVMAQELLKTNPEAVSNIEGILHVDYNKIDVNMEVI